MCYLRMAVMHLPIAHCNRLTTVQDNQDYASLIFFGGTRCIFMPVSQQTNGHTSTAINMFIMVGLPQPFAYITN